MNAPTRRLDDVADVQVGFAFKSADFVASPGRFRLLRNDNLGHGQTRWSGGMHLNPTEPIDERYQLRVDDIAVAMDRPWIGSGLKYAVIQTHDLPALLVQRVARLRARPGMSQRYLGYVVAGKSFSNYVRSIQTGTAIPHISASALGAYRFTPGQFVEQEALVEVLTSLDDKIAANAELARTADELSRACFDRAMTRPGRTESLLFDRFDVAFGEPFRGSLFSKVGVGRPLIRIRDLFTCAPKLWSTESRVRETLVQAGDVLIGMDAEFTPVVWLGEDGLLNQRVCKVVGRDNLSRVTTRLALTRPISAIESEKSGTTVIHLNRADLERTRVELPSEHTLEEFDHLANPLHDLTVSLAEESRRLAWLRDTLLPHLMSGRLKVRDAEKTVSDAV